ncbi:MAG: 1-hydroxy-2-methyl-2-butenyl 4-diphosphate reductase [Myxococcota bacterium]|nr:1-hydroxy-2-methyl-2-butenyl 4-diphosphate reductase [Myxococcota bacterium]
MTRGDPSPLVVAAPLGVEARALRRGGLRAVRTGVGPRRSRQAARRLADDPAAALAVAGLCGALEPGLVPGEVVVASELRAEGLASVALDPEPVRAALAERGISARVGALRCTDHVVRGAARARLAEDGAVAVDMESAWLAAGAAGRPLAVLRVVLDGPEHELFRPELPRQVFRALRRLREVAPALARWAAEVASAPPAAQPSRSLGTREV